MEARSGSRAGDEGCREVDEGCERAQENAGKSLKSLVEAKSQIEVVQPPRFTWITSGMLTGQSPAISEVGDLQKPGEEFMKTVFGLSPGQVAVATNRSKSEIYVIRMISLTPFQSLWDQYISEDTSQDTTQEYLGVMRYGIRRRWTRLGGRRF